MKGHEPRSCLQPESLLHPVASDVYREVQAEMHIIRGGKKKDYSKKKLLKITRAYYYEVHVSNVI